MHSHSHTHTQRTYVHTGNAPTVAEGGWFKFDDKCVSPWDPSDIEVECFGGCSENAERPNSAYMLFYDRKVCDY